MTQRKKEELELAKKISSSYNNKADIYDDINAKLELFKHISIDNETLEYSLSLYALEVQILVKALKFREDYPYRESS